MKNLSANPKTVVSDPASIRCLAALHTTPGENTRLRGHSNIIAAGRERGGGR